MCVSLNWAKFRLLQMEWKLFYYYTYAVAQDTREEATRADCRTTLLEVTLGNAVRHACVEGELDNIALLGGYRVRGEAQTFLASGDGDDLGIGQ